MSSLSSSGLSTFELFSKQKGGRTNQLTIRAYFLFVSQIPFPPPLLFVSYRRFCASVTIFLYNDSIPTFGLRDFKLSLCWATFASIPAMAVSIF